MTTLDILFAAIGVIAAASAILAVTTRNLVHAALWLVVLPRTLAGCYLVLGAELVALVQVLVYVGAVVVLVLFALMLTRAPIGPHRELAPAWPQRVAGAVVAAGTAALLAAVLVPPSATGPLRSATAAPAQSPAAALRHLGVAVRAALAAAARGAGRRLRGVADARRAVPRRADRDPRGEGA